LFFEGTTAFLFETDGILLDIAGEGRGGSQRRRARAAETVEVDPYGVDRRRWLSYNARPAIFFVWEHEPALSSHVFLEQALSSHHTMALLSLL
jgi:hypothetical protein